MKKFLSKARSQLDEGISSQSQAQTSSSLKSTDLSSPPSIRDLYQYQRQRGVNLGSLFSLEKWLTPSVYEGCHGDGKCELDVARGKEAKKRLEQHWDSFISSSDWQWMTDHGVNTVRLPIAYYHVLPEHPSCSNLMKGTEYEDAASAYAGAWSRIEAVIQTAASHKIGVLVDLHGAPGSANGEEHGGLANGKAGLWDSKALQEKTIKILVELARLLGPHDNVVGLELLNEPKNGSHLEKWYRAAISAIRSQAGDAAKDLPIYLGDGWTTDHYAGLVGSLADQSFVVVDHHLYRCFTDDDKATSASDHAARVRQNGQTGQWLSSMTTKARGNLIVGEWSAALHETSWPKGGGKLAARTEWARAQLESFELNTAGNFFWTFKKGGDPDPGWCFIRAVEKEVLPSNLDIHQTLSRPAPPDSKGDELRGAALQSHTSYWDANGGAKDEHWRFDEGFKVGWNDARSFHAGVGGVRGMVGFEEQWARTRRAAHESEKGGQKHAWEFEHGCLQGVRAFKSALMA